MKTNREELMEQYEVEDDTIFLESPDFDSAIVGISQDGAVIYEYSRMVEYLIGGGMTEEEAEDWISYNKIRAIPYMEGIKPVILYRMGND